MVVRFVASFKSENLKDAYNLRFNVFFLEQSKGETKEGSIAQDYTYHEYECKEQIRW